MTLQSPTSLSTPREPGKPSRARWRHVSFFFVILACGCASRPDPAARTEYLLAARYDLGAKRADKSGGRSESLLDDLQKIKTLGFNAVVFDYVDDAERATVLNLAGNCGLWAYLTDRDVHYYLLTGKFRGSDNLASLIASRTSALKTQPAYAGMAILSGYPPQRVAEVFAELHRAGVAYLYPGQSRYAAGRGAVVAWLDVDEKYGAGVSQVERLLLELNGEIFSGWNDGLVIDFAPPRSEASGGEPSDTGTLKEVDQPDSASTAPEAEAALPAPGPRSRMFAVESLLRRANTWGARLRGFEWQAIAPVQSGIPVSSAIFTRGARRYVFILNQSSQPLRGPVRFTAIFGGRPITRAVGVPATADRIAGEVFEARGTELTIQINLRAGDAALFELF